MILGHGGVKDDLTLEDKIGDNNVTSLCIFLYCFANIDVEIDFQLYYSTVLHVLVHSIWLNLKFFT